MTERLFSFRWDVDHRVCMTDGMPRILEVCREFDVPNTFFINMGRSTNLREWLGKGVSKSRAKLKDREAVHLIQKTGWPRFTLETVLSRPVGLSFVEDLRAVQAAGHELGLHGGMDHVVWSRRFSELSNGELEADVSESRAHFIRHFGEPVGFSAPGFKTDDRLKSLLDGFGFTYSGDRIGGRPQRARAGERELRHWTIPVTLAGPRTIPFLEWHGARGTAENEIMAGLDEHLGANDLVVLYGHPCYEGVNRELLRKIFDRVLGAGFRFVTHAEIASRLTAGTLEAASRDD
jgi:peptidoglycan/xylan/chitin deacetylase (PgdA/CDA1 family)